MKLPKFLSKLFGQNTQADWQKQLDSFDNSQLSPEHQELISIIPAIAKEVKNITGVDNWGKDANEIVSFAVQQLHSHQTSSAEGKAEVIHTAFSLIERQIDAAIVPIQQTIDSVKNSDTTEFEVALKNIIAIKEKFDGLKATLGYDTEEIKIATNEINSVLEISR